MATPNSSNNTNAPPGSTLMLLSSLPHVALGTKVCFRATVASYSHDKSTLHLSAKHPGPARVLLNTDLVAESARGALEIGAWLRVVGYVTAQAGAATSVQAVLVQRADSVGATDARLALDYEGAVARRRAGMAAMAGARAEDAAARAAGAFGEGG